MVAGIGETGEALEKDLQLEQMIDFPIERQPRQPRVSGLCVLAAQSARVAQQIIVDVALIGCAIQPKRGHGQDVTSSPERASLRVAEASFSSRQGPITRARQAGAPRRPWRGHAACACAEHRAPGGHVPSRHARLLPWNAAQWNGVP
jgi:hypothetical protein